MQHLLPPFAINICFSFGCSPSFTKQSEYCDVNSATEPAPANINLLRHHFLKIKYLFLILLSLSYCTPCDLWIYTNDDNEWIKTF